MLPQQGLQLAILCRALPHNPGSLPRASRALRLITLWRCGEGSTMHASTSTLVPASVAKQLRPALRPLVVAQGQATRHQHLQGFNRTAWQIPSGGSQRSLHTSRVHGTTGAFGSSALAAGRGALGIRCMATGKDDSAQNPNHDNHLNGSSNSSNSSSSSNSPPPPSPPELPVTGEFSEPSTPTSINSASSPLSGPLSFFTSLLHPFNNRNGPEASPMALPREAPVVTKEELADPEHGKDIVDSPAEAFASQDEARARRIQDALKAGELGFGFSAGGFLYCYHLGVLWELERLGLLRPGGDTLLAGASAGSLAIATFTCGISRDDTVSALRAFAENCRTAGTRGRLTTLLREFLHQYLPDDAHERCSGKCYVSLTRLSFPYPRHEAISEFHDKSDLVEALLTSCHIPYYASGAWTTRFRGATYVDGGATHFVPAPPTSTVVKVCCLPVRWVIQVIASSFPVGQLLDRLRPSLQYVPRATSVTNIAISPDAFEAWNHSMAKLVNWALQPAGDEVLDMLIDKGIKDANSWAKTMDLHELSPQLKRALAGEPPRKKQKVSH